MTVIGFATPGNPNGDAVISCAADVPAGATVYVYTAQSGSGVTDSVGNAYTLVQHVEHDPHLTARAYLNVWSAVNTNGLGTGCTITAQPAGTHHVAYAVY